MKTKSTDSSEIKKKQNIISASTHNSLFTSGCEPGILYGLPKIHKTDTPLRPILAYYNTAAYKISKFIVPLLEPYTHNSFSFSNSYALVGKLKAIRLNTTSFLCSFDVQSLFTNVSLDETIDIICNTVFQNTDRFHNFPKTEFRSLLILASKKSTLHFQQNKLYPNRRVQYGLARRMIICKFLLSPP